MEGTEELLEFVGPSNEHGTVVTHIAKGKRTKRRPCALATALTSSSSSVSGEHLSAGADYASISSTTTTTTHNYDDSTEEEEDMANCLILLAQGGDSHHNLKHRPQSHQAARTEPGGSRRFADMSTVTAGAAKVGLFVYECKTCNRSFPSFQALGGHRASHKRPRLTLDEKKLPPQLINSYEIEEGRPMKNSPQISLQLGNNNIMNGIVSSINKAKIHECSICGSEFTSGQALGGHMRRHRPTTAAGGSQASYGEVAGDRTVAAVEVKPKVLALDLNLPAPEEDHHQRESKFEVTAKEKPLMLSAPTTSLVGCHY
ncbi:hypothetical protein QN277_002966 [Acacia crassicarpa]|uniref:C2H2-type domain-containing protein n=1 Tax=Acacia crassicarpa TaxID=499986 RepID=A0AAE1NBU7_9FABA|nr:hypothetical protein QN277_002966 [Acacia crassicarpa]